MTSTVLELLKMAVYLHPEYAETFEAIQEECETFCHQVDSVPLKLAISIMCTQSPLMIEEYPESYRLEVEKVLLSDLKTMHLH